MFVVIEKMNGYLLLAQEIVQSTVGIEAAKYIKIGDIFYRYVAWSAFGAIFINGGKLEGVILAAEAAGIEQVIGFFHGWYTFTGYCIIFLSKVIKVSP